jgi:hypothetical protein
MNTVNYANEIILPAALELLPMNMDTTGARAFVIAVGLQETEYIARRQNGMGPARGFHQFEQNGVLGVMGHRHTSVVATGILKTMGYYDSSTGQIHAALEHNDVLDHVLARLLLWTSPKPLPVREDPEGAWEQYYFCWRPGKPRRDDWNANYARAWALQARAPA